jgi:hypothetical protein
MFEKLNEQALQRYQHHLAIIQRLYIIGAMPQKMYTESCESAAMLWAADQREIAGFETRQNLINLTV